MTVSLLHPDWLDWEPVKDVLIVLEAAGAEVRFYGGCVRNALFGGGAPKDFDMITSLTAEEVQVLLRGLRVSADIQGTQRNKISFAYKNHIFDIKESVATPADSVDFALRVQAMMRERCDFSINALCLSPLGLLYDDFSGLRDGLDGAIRFIGDTISNIKGIPIGILRFFRFYAWYGKIAPNAETLAICEDLRHLLENEPEYMIRDEMLKLLAAPLPSASIALMKDCGVLEQAFGFAIENTTRLAGLERMEALIHEAPDPLLRLAALLLAASVSPGIGLAHIAEGWQLPDASCQRLRQLLALVAHMNPVLNGALKENLLRQEGKKGYRQLILLHLAAPGGLRSAASINECLDQLEAMGENGDCPLDRQQLLAAVAP